MENIFRFSLAVWILFTTAAGASNLTDDLRAALADNDYARLQSLMTDAHQDALQSKDFTDIRTAYTTLFVVANAGRMAQADAWLAAHPNSQYAAAALAWMHIERAFLLRGGAYANETSREAMMAFRDEMTAAKRVNDIALKISTDFLPAVDASLKLGMVGADRRPVSRLVEWQLDVAPGRGAIARGLTSLQPSWGSPIQDSFDLCTEFADRVSDYSVDLCIMEIAFMNDVDGQLRQSALKTLDASDDPRFDYARLGAYLNEWKGRKNAASEAMRIQTEALGPGTDPASFERSVGRVSQAFGKPFFKIEMLETLEEFAEESLRDNPDNY
ncbi:MAG: DUF4034 domain-containing protein, partial [Paracoccaceae bacterium]|nr:DUF4034 domain-containing protein [Paracoccaceae bacterium]